MLVVHQLSQGTWGRVLSLRDDQTGDIAPRPIAGRNKTITHSEEVSVSITPSDPDAAAIYEPMTISLGLKTWAKQVPDIDALWAEWDALGRITSELLADVPEPHADVLARARAQRLAADDAWLADQDAAGIDVGGIVLFGDAESAVMLDRYIEREVAKGTPVLLFSDTAQMPHFVPLANVAELAATYEAEFARRRYVWAMSKSAVAVAESVEAIQAIPVPA